MKTKLKNIDRLIPIISVLMVFIIWWLSVELFDIKPYILPSPIDVFKSIGENKELLWTHTRITLFEAVVGLTISIILSYIIAIIMDYVLVIKKFLYPLFVISQTVPLMAIAPLMIIWIGLGIDAKIMVVILVCAFPLTINILTGLEEVDQDHIDFFNVMGASVVDKYMNLKIPFSLPYFFSGLKIAATYAVLGALIAEYMGAKSGLGIYLSRSMSSFNKNMVFGIIIVIVVVTLLLIFIIQYIENLVLKYKRKGSN